MMIIHVYNVPNIRIVRLDKNFRKKLRNKFLKKFGSINKTANYYSHKFDINVNTMNGFLKAILNSNTKSMPVSTLVKIAKDNGINKQEVEFHIRKVKGPNAKSPIIKCKYPLKIENIYVPKTKNNEFHSWEIDNLQIKEIDKILAKKLRRLIFLRFGAINIATYYYAKLTRYKYQWARSLLNWIISSGGKRSKDNIPIDFFVKIIEDNGISRLEAEKYLLKVKVKHGELFLNNPKFPIKINPVLMGLATHFYGDGCTTQYSQALFHKLNRKVFLKKIEYSIGKINNWNPKTKDFAIPTLVYKTLESTLGITKRHIKDKIFPDKILNFPKEYKLAILSSIIVDEGHIEQCSIEIKQKRKKFLTVIYELCKELGYDVSGIKIERKTNPKRHVYAFYLKVEGMHKLYNDLNELIDKYGFVLSLGDKQQIFEKFMQRHIKNGRCKFK